MKLSDIYTIADSIAPKKLSDAYCASFGACDNSGVLIDCGDEIKGILFSLDLSFAAIEAAEKEGANLIITHHPAMYGKLNHARAEADDLVERKLVQCLRKGISVLSMHLNLDVASGGIDESLQQGIRLSAQSVSQASAVNGNVDTQYMHAFEGGAYGRSYEVAQTSLSVLAQAMKKEFCTQQICVFGAESKTINRVASFCGSGADEEAVRFAWKTGADAVVSSDFKHHVLTYATELGMAVIALTHYASENYGFKKYFEKIREQVEVSCVYHEDTNLL